MKAIITICITSMATACSHVATKTQPPAQAITHLEPERRSTEDEIRQHIVGEWKVAAESDGCWYPTLIIGQDRTLVGVRTNGNSDVVGTWDLDGTLLRVAPTPAPFDLARKVGHHLNGWVYFPVVYTDAHDLVMTPGLSVAGRWRYKR